EDETAMFGKAIYKAFDEQLDVVSLIAAIILVQDKVEWLVAEFGEVFRKSIQQRVEVCHVFRQQHIQMSSESWLLVRNIMHQPGKEGLHVNVIRSEGIVKYI